MVIQRCRKGEFAVIGKKGSTSDGEDFVNVLWRKTNTGMDEIADLTDRDRNGVPVGFWGLRSASDMSFSEWEDGEGLYLAGVEAKLDAFAPMGWTKWVIPASSYVSVEVEGSIEKAVEEVKKYAKKNKLTITGAYHEYMNAFLPGKLLLFFPVTEPTSFVFENPNLKK